MVSPGGYSNSDHPSTPHKPQQWLHFSMTPRLPHGQPPTGSTRSKQPPRPAGLGGRLILYIKSPTDARTHPYSQQSMSHRKIRSTKVTSPARCLTVSPGGHSNSIHHQPPLNKPKGALPPHTTPTPRRSSNKTSKQEGHCDYVLVPAPLGKDVNCNVISVPMVPPTPWVSNYRAAICRVPSAKSTVETSRGHTGTDGPVPRVS